VDAVAKLSVEAVGVEEREKQLEVFFLAVMRRRCHQQEVAGLRTQLFRQPEAASLLQFAAEEMCGEFVRLVKHNEVPSSSA
jgi:hypothetical protein